MARQLYAACQKQCDLFLATEDGLGGQQGQTHHRVWYQRLRVMLPIECPSGLCTAHLQPPTHTGPELYTVASSLLGKQQKCSGLSCLFWLWCFISFSLFLSFSLPFSPLFFPQPHYLTTYIHLTLQAKLNNISHFL